MNKTQKNRELKRKQQNLDDYREQFSILYSQLRISKKPLDEIERFFHGNKENLGRLILVDAAQAPIPKARSSGTDVSFLPILSVLFPILSTTLRQKLVLLFLENGGDLNQTNYKGDHSALYSAVLLGDKDLIKKLMKSGAQLDVLKGYQKEVYESVIGSQPKSKSRKKMPFFKHENKNVSFKNKQASPNKASPNKASPKQASPNKASPKQAEIPRLPYEMDVPKNHYNPSEEPVFWKPLFQEGEMFKLREEIQSMMRSDCDLGALGKRNNWSLCNIIKNFLPTYFVPTQNKPYIPRPNVAFGVSSLDFSNFNVILCASFLVFGLVNDRMKEQDYQFLLKGGKAIQLALAETETEIDPYESEDIDILIRPKKAYDREEIKRVAGHLASLMKWFVELEMTQCNLSIQDPDTKDANADLYKLSYILTGVKSARPVFRAFSDIDFKEIPKDDKKYYTHLSDSTYNLDELGLGLRLGNLFYLYANRESMLDEKLFYYAKFEELSHLNKIEPGQTPDECRRFMDKFKRAILALTHALQKDKPGTEKDYIRVRLQRLYKRDPVTKERILQLLYP